MALVKKSKKFDPVLPDIKTKNLITIKIPLPPVQFKSCFSGAWFVYRIIWFMPPKSLVRFLGNFERIFLKIRYFGFFPVTGISGNLSS
jgi:hypothetical protein